MVSKREAPENLEVDSNSEIVTMNSTYDNQSVSTFSSREIFKKPRLDSYTKCTGLKLETNVFLNFPFQLFEINNLKDEFTFENGAFHSVECTQNNYNLTSANSDINQSCYYVKYNTNFKSILKRSNEIPKFTNHSFMTYLQLKQELDEKNTKINSQKLETLNLRRSNITLNNQLSDYKRFKILVSQNDIPRIHVLVKSCIKSNYGINGIIEKIKQAIAGSYKPKGYGQKDIDLAILVLRIGGPRLLYTFNKLNQLPSSSLVNKALNTTMNIELSYSKTISEMVLINMSKFFDENGFDRFYSIKIDEIAISPKIRWSPGNNEILGFCFNHKFNIKSYSFDSWVKLVELKNKYQKNEIHLCKEALVITLSRISNTDIIPRPILVLPICCHSNENLISNSIKIIIETFERICPDGQILNVATYGDPNRRVALNLLRKPNETFISL
ncbi:unnamed protein product [Brachionus calyciflorus]|uniref:Uncharacterized protein n=1 Tax=Brachionus calyciflorus TaxID=104777 RepID=A0A813ZS71_9BILA|nr:unnamed protein product [Brachionus calyciflorus]